MDNKVLNKLNADYRERSVSDLQELLYDCISLYLLSRQAHWNVRGPQFLTLHNLFGDVYSVLESQADDIAERIAQLGGIADGSASSVASESEITDEMGGYSNGPTVAVELAKWLAAYSSDLVDGFESCTGRMDHGTADMLIGFSREVDKKVWMLESFSM